MSDNDDILDAVGKGCKFLAKSAGTVALGAVGLLGLAGKAAGVDLGIAEFSAEGIEHLWASDEEKKQMDINFAYKTYQSAILTARQCRDEDEYDNCVRTAWKSYQFINSNSKLNSEELYQKFKTEFDYNVKKGINASITYLPINENVNNVEKKKVKVSVRKIQKNKSKGIHEESVNPIQTLRGKNFKG